MSRIEKVVSTVWYDKESYHKLRNVIPQARFVYADFYDREKLEEEVRDADVAILLGDVPDCLLGENRLKWIACDHAGLNGSTRDEVFAKGVIVTGAAGRSAPVLAEHAIYFMLQYCYHTKELLKAQEEGTWGVAGSAGWYGLYGRKAGIIGMGHTGKQLAKRLLALGLKVYACNRSPFDGFEGLERKLIGAQGDTFDEILEECDFIILTLALNDETYHLIGEERIGQMKDDAFLVNIARGGLVDTQALTQAISQGMLGGAGLDVLEEDPLPSEHPLWRLPGVYITPHTTPQVPDRAGASIEIIRENARRFEAGEPMLNQMTEKDRFHSVASTGGFARLMQSDMPKEEIARLPLDKFLGKRGWSDPAEWNYVD